MYWNLSCFFCIYGNDHMFFFFSLLISWTIIIYFQILTLNSQYKPHLCHDVLSFFCIDRFDLVIFLRVIWLCSWWVLAFIYSCVVFLWLSYQDNAGLIKWFSSHIVFFRVRVWKEVTVENYYCFVLKCLVEFVIEGF